MIRPWIRVGLELVLVALLLFAVAWLAAGMQIRGRVMPTPVLFPSPTPDVVAARHALEQALQRQWGRALSHTIAQARSQGALAGWQPEVRLLQALVLLRTPATWARAQGLLQGLASTSLSAGEAARELALTLQRTRSQPRAYRLVELGRALARWGYWGLAHDLWLQARRVAPNYAAAATYAGLGWLHFGQPARAERAWKQARRLDPSDPLPAYLLGLYYLRQEWPALATAWLWRALYAQPTQPLYRYALAHSLARQRGLFPEAWQVMEHAVVLAPQNPQAYRLAAAFALEHRVHLQDRALPWLRQLLQRHPEDVPGLVLMARVYLELGQPLVAARFLTRAQALDPTHPDLHRTWALYYFQQNQPQAATYHRQLARKYARPGLWPTEVP